MKQRVEELIHGYFTDEISGVPVPPLPVKFRRRRFPGAEASLAAAACLFVVFSGAGCLSLPPLAEKAASFAEVREVGITITRGLESARNAARPVLRKGEKK